MNVIAIDPSLKSTGVFLRVLDKNVNFSISPDKNLDIFNKLCYIYDEVQAKCIQYHFNNGIYDLGIIEGFSYGSQGNAVYQQGMIGGVLRMLLCKRCKKVIEIPPRTWKALTMPKEFQKLKKGTKKKDAIYCDVINNIYNTNFSITDEADAFLLYKTVELYIDNPVNKKYKTIRELLDK